MDADFILERVQHMRPSSFSVRERQRYQAEKMLMRQFILMKQQHQVPTYLSAKDMKTWLLTGRSFLEEFPAIVEWQETRKLLLAELVWSSERRLCLDQMEQELREELGKESYLSLLFRRKVTLEGMHMLLSKIRPRAEQDVLMHLCHLSNKLLSSFTSSYTSKRDKLRLFTRLQRTTQPLLPQVVDIALKFLLDELEPPVEARTAEAPLESGEFSSTSALESRTQAASTDVGKLLADAAATCFCLNTSFTKARLLQICTSVASDMVQAIYRRCFHRCETFKLLDFDESFFVARESVVCTVQDMDDRVRSAVNRWTPRQLSPETDPEIPEVCSVVAPKETDGEKNTEQQEIGSFFCRLWKKLIRDH